jgi:quinol-cytochrome oxidoreductase complex cytochrome b subunit
MVTQAPITDEKTQSDGHLTGNAQDDTVFAFPIVLLWEAVLALGVMLAIFVFALVKQAPLEDIANPLVTTDPAKAPWYFVGLQELFDHMHPTLAGVMIPGILVACLIALPYIDHSRANAGVWFSSARGKRIVAGTALYTLIVMPAYIALDNAFSARELLRETAPLWVAQGLVPGGIIALLVALPALGVWRLKGNTRELVLVLFTVLLFSAIVFTTSGFLFRGPGFKLYWPWQMPDGYNPWDGL